MRLAHAFNPLGAKRKRVSRMITAQRVELVAGQLSAQQHCGGSRLPAT